jgi:hypothetical protein
MALKICIHLSFGNVKVWKGIQEEVGEVNITNARISHEILSEFYTYLIKA